jgi:hypothetical protein
MTIYGIGYTDTFNSVWYVVDAVNRHPRFNIVYPDDHDKQRSIAPKASRRFQLLVLIAVLGQ